MKRIGIACLCIVLCLAGCKKSTKNSTEKGTKSGNGGTSEVTPVPVESGKVALKPENTSIRFHGTKKDGEHWGGFEKFTGTLKLDEAGKTLEGVEVKIDTTSLWADNKKLEGHLKNADFFHVNEYPESTFTSTSVQPADGEEGKYMVTGKFTLHGVTKELEFPATVTISEKGLILKSEFKFDRTDYDINFDPDKVNKEVSVHVTVGQRTSPEA